MSTTTETKPIFGLLAEFDDVDTLMAAANKVREAGYRKCDAFAPYPVHGLAEAIGYRKTKIPALVLCGALSGTATAYAMMWFSNVIHYPIIIAGRPQNSWPAWIPIMFELTVLGAALTAVFGMLALNGLPQPYHPLFNAPNFGLASRDKFFICIESTDPQFDASTTKSFLEGIEGQNVSEVQP